MNSELMEKIKNVLNQIRTENYHLYLEIIEKHDIKSEKILPLLNQLGYDI